MRRIDFNTDWDYRQAHWQAPQDRTKVDLPHDYSMELPRTPHAVGGDTTGFFDGGEIIYSKELFAPEEWKNKTVILEFEGVYMNAAVKLNGNIIKKHPYGYTTFHVVLNKYLKYNETNIIEVKAANISRNSRWYSGTGIYRPVWLMVADLLHIRPWGTYITTENISEKNARIKIDTSINVPSEIGNIEEGYSGEITVLYSIYSPDGEKAAEWIVDSNIGKLVNGVIKAEITLENPLLWDIETPNLYKLTTVVKSRDGRFIDDCEETFGIRTISVSREHGFRLGGKTLKLKGGCIHHDNGIIGAASYRSSEERKVRLMKEAGYNAVRCAHNPPSVSFLDACDRLGMLVMDEIFDSWVEGKNPNDYSLYFEEWWERDFEAMLLRDRNHPSIIAWSTGNEIPERSGKTDGYAWAGKLADFAREYDNTRFITNALCEVWDDMEGLAANTANAEAMGKFGIMTEDFIAPLDVAGYNYLHFRYKDDSEFFPERIICGTESHPLKVFENWEEINALPSVIGDFVWTALDYFGEAGVGHIWYNGEKSFCGDYPWHVANCGDFDICGFKRPQSYYRDAVWGVTKTPYIAVYRPEFYDSQADISAWGWQDVISAWEFEEYVGKKLHVEIYCSCDEVELFLNGKSLGRKPCGAENKYKVLYEVLYEAGTLTAVSYNKIHEKQDEYTLVTPGAPCKLKVVPESFNNNSDVCFIRIELSDINGNPIRFSDREINVDISGGKLLALGSADPKSEEMYNKKHRRLFEGKALAVIKPISGESASLTVKAEYIEEETAVHFRCNT